VAHKGERIVVERYGKDAIAIVSVGDLELLELLEDRLDLEEARKALADIRRRGGPKRGTIPWSKIKAAAGL
jgi:hypothetical protein